MPMDLKTINIEIADSAKVEIARIMETYSSEEYCPMLCYTRTLKRNEDGDSTATPWQWRIMANEYARLDTAPSYYEVGGMVLYIAAPHLIEAGTVLDFQNGEFFFNNGI